MKKTALAHANIALVKYWGKRDYRLNLPAVGSISMTLKDLYTRTSVEFRSDLSQDILFLNGQPAGEHQRRRVSIFLDHVREMSGETRFAEVISENNFPTGAGLASSASGFAALSLAATVAAGLHLSARELSALARLGSGSAARSIFGGFVEMQVGEKPDGSDAVAVQLHDEQYWPLDMLIVLTSESPKTVGSTEGMQRTAATSPYFRSWVASSAQDIQAMRQALAEKDFTRVGEITEHSCLKMHGLMLSARPGLIYWNGLTVTLIHEVRRLRQQGLEAYFTIDAGPQVKVLCRREEAGRIRQALETVEGVRRIIHTTVGPGARLVSDQLEAAP
ncbi:MAG: diphosphomevalonate decarboxylase [Calditrichaeota bacterium]|nr:MAG: diphosphomevalonate decarboxylase [Calditrichota bacterium]